MLIGMAVKVLYEGKSPGLYGIHAGYVTKSAQAVEDNLLR